MTEFIFFSFVIIFKHREYINNDEEKEYKVKKSVKVKDTKDKANIRYRKLYKKYAKSKKVVTKSKLAGELAVFVRFRGCNLDCSYCDTRWANDVNAKAVKMSVSDIVKAVEDAKIDNVTLTGGEPLIQAGIDELIAQLLISGRNVEIETNGSVDINKVRENVKDNLTTAMNGQVINDIYDKVNNEMGRLSMTADYKLAGSNMEQYMKLDNFNNLQSQDTVKFVVSSEEDLKRALEIIRQYNLAEKCYVYFSPVFGKIEPVTIVDFMKNNLINGARVQLQLHKFIWSPDKKGV